MGLTRPMAFMRFSSGKASQNEENASGLHPDFQPRVKTPANAGSVEDLIRHDVSSNRVFLYMKGYPNAPQCGFSAQVVRILQKEGMGLKHFLI